MSVFGFTLVNDNLQIYLITPSALFTSPPITCTGTNWDAPLHLMANLATMTEEDLGMVLPIKDHLESLPPFTKTLPLPSPIFSSEVLHNTSAPTPKSLEIIHELSPRSSLTGRATSTFAATLNSSRNAPALAVVAKVSYAEPERMKKEIEVFRQIAAHEDKAEVEGLAEALAIYQGTETRGMGKWEGKDTLGRIPLLVVMGEEFRELKSVCSGTELIKVVLDVISAHKNLFNLGWLHRDVSINNMMIGRDGRGRLNDYDLATPVGKTESTCGHRTGTRQFLARGLLLTKPEPHCVGHDLESVLWVVLFLVFSYEPGGVKRTMSSKQVDWVLHINGSIDEASSYKEALTRESRHSLLPEKREVTEQP
ncbi:hypothetical protein T439DRAFT_383847 [Meredithblackwellia eburnea MCA 4105]